MSRPPVARAERYAVLGHPVEHSRSPYIHAAFAQQTGQDLVYERVLVPLDAEGGTSTFPDAVTAFAAAGDTRGCNVTLPFKFEALRLAGRPTPRALLAGAANTLRFDGGAARAAWLADNTDGIGLVRDLQEHQGFGIAGARVLLVGAGGAGAGVLGPLIEARPRSLVLANRSAGKATALAQRHAGWAAEHGVAFTTAPLEAPGEAFDLVINASSSSLAGAASPVPAGVLRRGTLAVDLMYGPAAAPFLAWARAQGAVERDGLGMLVEQAAESFWLWRGVRPQTAPVLDALRAQLRAAP